MKHVEEMMLKGWMSLEHGLIQAENHLQTLQNLDTEQDREWHAAIDDTKVLIEKIKFAQTIIAVKNY